MVLKVLGSSSQGNCYILENDTEILLIELGVSFNKVKQALGYDLSNVKGVLVSHEHGDHAKYTNDALFYGLDVFMSKGTRSKLSLKKEPSIVKSGEQFTTGGFTIIPFDVIHDCAEPFGYYINHEETGNILFITDSMYSKYKFADINNMIIEANYCEHIIEERIKSGKLSARVGSRSMGSHMSFQQTLKLIGENDITGVNNIVLCHLSDGNSNEKEFKEATENATLKNVTVAGPGVEIEFNKYPF